MDDIENNNEIEDDSPINQEHAGVMTLLQVHAAIKERGIELGYSSLSELLKVGDALDQLNVGGTRGKREFPAETVDILVEFLPEFRRADTKNSKFAEELKKFLRRRNRAARPAPIREPLRELSNEELDRIQSEAGSALVVRESDPGLSLPAMLEGRARGLAEGDLRLGKLLTAREAATICQVSESLLRKTIPAYIRFGKTASGDRWRISDLFGGNDASGYKGY